MSHQAKLLVGTLLPHKYPTPRKKCSMTFLNEESQVTNCSIHTLITSSETTPENWLESSVPPAPSMPRDSQFNHPRGLLDERSSLCNFSEPILAPLTPKQEFEFNRNSYNHILYKKNTY